MAEDSWYLGLLTLIVFSSTSKEEEHAQKGDKSKGGSGAPNRKI
jgi:hypothetical protein